MRDRWELIVFDDTVLRSSYNRWIDTGHFFILMSLWHLTYLWIKGRSAIGSACGGMENGDPASDSCARTRLETRHEIR